MIIRYRRLKRILCLFRIHWEGWSGLGMYGDAARCAVCGKDRYGLVVLHERALSEQREREST